MADRIHFVFLNIGHFYDHLFMLVFATVAALTLSQEWGRSYAELIPYATPGFVAFGVCAVPAGWLADKWSRNGMMVVFYMGTASVGTRVEATPIMRAISSRCWALPKSRPPGRHVVWLKSREPMALH